MVRIPDHDLLLGHIRVAQIPARPALFAGKVAGLHEQKRRIGRLRGLKTVRPLVGHAADVGRGPPGIRDIRRAPRKIGDGRVKMGDKALGPFLLAHDPAHEPQ